MTKSQSGRYGGSRAVFFEHEITNWIRTRVRVSTGEPAADPIPMPEHPRFISIREVEKRVGYSRVHIWRLEQAGKFPQRVRMRGVEAA